MIDSKTPVHIEPIKRLILAGYPLVYLVTWEERRVAEQLLAMTTMDLKPVRHFITWSVTEGYSDAPMERPEAKGDPIAALDRVIDNQEPAIYVLKDFHSYLDRQDVIRRVRDVFYCCRDSEKTVIFLGPILNVPAELQKQMEVADIPLPDFSEIAYSVEEELRTLTKHHGKKYKPIPQSDHEQIIKSFLGMTRDEICATVRKVGIVSFKFDGGDIEQILEEKRQILRKTEILDFIKNDYRMEHVGGLANFKGWCRVRAQGFTDAARDYGLPAPKGVLITGISGCGKSLAIQALANEWRLPLLRLDMGRIFAGYSSSPEESMRRAMQTVEAVAPAILWIDEIEMGVSVFSDSVESGSTSRIFASFLTWMQEKKASVFVAATANDIDRLPPEMIRKGRFDEVFFVDLPDRTEREEIIRIHLTTRGKDVAEVSVQGLGQSTEGFTGAEIEQAIINAMYHAFSEHREVTMSDIYSAIGSTVPLSVTMKEQITKTKRWADNRAVRAN
jgi:SpoVK/Ycf46/Vps4 family AAA+-type ATPase